MTGSVFPDIDREVPVISLASGRVVDIRTRLDDNVKKGQLLIKVQSPDVTNAYDTYLKAANDEHLANDAYVRAKDLFSHGAISQSMLEQAEDTENDAKADLNAAEQQLATLGVPKNHPSSIVNVYAPISGVIVAQNVTNAAAAGMTYSGTSNAFTIADLSVVWIVCDVYENDLPNVHLGQEAQIHIDAYPSKQLTGRISDIGPVLDPAIRTAKVRIEVRNPGILRLGMFVTATLFSRTKEAHAVVPSSAILHLHDREWVFVPAGGKQFKRVEVNEGKMLPGNMQEILSGIAPGQQVVLLRRFCAESRSTTSPCAICRDTGIPSRLSTTSVYYRHWENAFHWLNSAPLKRRMKAQKSIAKTTNAMSPSSTASAGALWATR